MTSGRGRLRVGEEDDGVRSMGKSSTGRCAGNESGRKSGPGQEERLCPIITSLDYPPPETATRQKAPSPPDFVHFGQDARQGGMPRWHKVYMTTRSMLQRLHRPSRDRTERETRSTSPRVRHLACASPALLACADFSLYDVPPLAALPLETTLRTGTNRRLL